MLEENYIGKIYRTTILYDLPNIIKKIERDKNKIDITDLKQQKNLIHKKF